MVSTVQNNDIQHPPTIRKKKNGIKISMKKKRKRTITKKEEHSNTTTTKTNNTLQNTTITAEQVRMGRAVCTAASLDNNKTESSPFDDEELLMEDLPCDTLLLLRSIIQNRQCVYIPLQTNGGCLLPAVIESQLYSKLEEEESIITQELQDLVIDK